MLKHHHTAHRINTLGIGNIVAFHAGWRFWQSQRLLQFCQRCHLPVAVSVPLGPEGLQSLHSVFSCHIQQFARRAGGWHHQFHCLPAPLTAQPGLDNTGFFHFLWQHQLLGDASCFCVELLDKLRQHLAVGFICGAFQDKVLATNQFTSADEEYLHAGFAIGSRNGNYV